MTFTTWLLGEASKKPKGRVDIVFRCGKEFKAQYIISADPAHQVISVSPYTDDVKVSNPVSHLDASEIISMTFL